MKDNGYDAVKKSGYVGSIIENGGNHYKLQFIVKPFNSGQRKQLIIKIMVNARPGSLRNERPNLLVNEAADEYQSFGGSKPNHVTVSAFTRLVGGPRITRRLNF
jgi:hypothetical protein